MTARLESALAKSYQGDISSLSAIGSNEVGKTRPNIGRFNEKLLFAKPTYLEEETGKVVVALSDPKPASEKLPDRVTSPIISKQDVEDGTTSIVDSAVTHSDQMHVDALLISLLGIVSGELSVDPVISERIVKRAAALLFGGASIAHYVVESNLALTQSKYYDSGQNYVDAGKLEHYVLTAETFHRILANRGVPTVDVHDFVHHAIQFSTWPDFFIPFYNIAYLVSSNLKKEDVEQRTPLYLLKSLISFLSFASAEYSVVGEKPDQSYSFGCLLYQYPRKSPMKKENLLEGTVTPREFTDWNSLRAMMSLKRREMANAVTFEKKLDWLSELGYTLPNQYWPELDAKGNLKREPVSDLDRSHQIYFAGLKLPSSPTALFANAAALLEKQFNEVKSSLPPSIQPGIEAWLHAMS